MHITFGMHVGTWHGPGSRSHVGEPVLGRPAFLALLETHLGLTGAPTHAARRAAAYLVALRAANNPQRFYHHSLQADEIGTAAKLLQWRDEWILGGWHGQSGTGWPTRLADMVAVEGFAARVPPGEGERLAKVQERLRVRRTPVTRVVLLDPIEAYPALWRDVLELLPTAPAPVAFRTAPANLGRFQALCAQAIVDESLPMSEEVVPDETLVVLVPRSCEEAEHWLAAECKRTPERNRIIVCEEHGASVDDTLRVHGIPACGFDEPSSLRPALQALPLALETLWDPIEPARLLEFLTHPIGPFGYRARRLLANAFAKQPGVGGREWSRARERIQQELGADDVAQVSFWTESKRSARSTGAPIDTVITRAEALRSALQLRLGAMQDDASTDSVMADLASAVGQCSALLDALGELQREGISLVRPRLLEQLTAQATANSSNTLAVAEVGCMQSASSPAATSCEGADEVIWWMPTKPKLPTPLPWVRAEVEALASVGVRLRDPAVEMAAQMAQWVRPVHAARQRLVLVLPPLGAEVHPAWQLAAAMCPRLQPQSMEEHIAVQELAEVVQHEPLPAPRGIWKLDPTAEWRASFAVPSRAENQSYSSLNVLFNNPAVAVLQDAAALRTASTLAVEDGSRLYGNLAHRLLERLFGQEGSLQWDEQQVTAWFEPSLEDLLQREGLPLLAAGNAMPLQQFRNALRHGIAVLLEHLRHAGAIRVQAERRLQGDLSGLPARGDTDLLIHLDGERTAAIDLKWSWATRFRNMMLKGDILQLAIYAHLIEQEIGAAPAAVGFFTFLDSTLLTSTPNLFGPSARVVRPAFALPQLIQMAIGSWNWRVQQWEEGDVEVIAEGLQPPPTDPPPGCLPRGELGPWYGDFVALFGAQETS